MVGKSLRLHPRGSVYFSLPERVQIHDATLRDGEQTPGIVMSVSDKIAIAEKLAEIGVDRIEAGMPRFPIRISKPSSKFPRWVEVEDLYLRSRDPGRY